REISVLMREEKILLVNAAPVIGEHGVNGAVLVFHDITNLRQLEKVRQDFVANVSHELRTPISSIKGYAETLLHGALEDKENAEDFLKIIYFEADRLAKLISDLLDLSTIESGKLTLCLKSCNVETVVQRVVSGLKPRVGAKLLTINLVIPKNIAKIVCDENMIAQVLLNLIDNAIKYTNAPGQISIKAIEQGGFVQIDVCDTGIGILEKDLPRLFERFYRVDKNRSCALGGTGLGLSIVKHIIQAHKGRVFVRSVFGQGSTFSFTIPKK
ncbi:MAG: PAS domain-containing sensor histidine kinase, partial [Candidatus Omnitrophota bacterium]